MARRAREANVFVRLASRFRQWWRRASLIQRLVLVAMVPSAVSTVLLATLLTQHQIRTTREILRSTESAYVVQAAAVAAVPLHRRDLPGLRRLAETIIKLPHVNHVRILDRDGKVLVNSQKGSRAGARSQIQLQQPIHDNDPSATVLGTLRVDIDSDSSLLAQHVSVFDTLLWLGIAIMLAILLSWQQARWISAPLRRLSVAMRGLGRNDQPMSVEVTDESEIGELQRGFNTAAAALYTLHREMELRIEDATRELAHKNAALEQASKAKARFLAGATHDLRQPLYALTLFSSSLAEKETDPVRLDRIAHVQQCIDSLDRLFGELLDLSRLEAGAMQPEMRDFPLDEVFQEVSRNFRIQAENQELRLITRPTDVWVHTDRTMLARILNNLVSNALRYTHQGGVLVGARKRGDRIRIDVRDTGVGIPSKHQAHIFEEFYRIDDGEHKQLGNRSSRRGQRGLGLGLSTAKRLAELLEAGFTLHSVPGHGSLFTLMLPASRKPPSKALRAVPGTYRSTQPSRDLAGLRVLVIDDDRAILAGLRDLLHMWGCQVHTAIDCESALEQVADMPDPPDIVITDLRLGSACDGVQALRRIAGHFHADPDDPPYASLLITGETEPGRLQQARASRLPILFKPVSAGELQKTIHGLLQHRREHSSRRMTSSTTSDE